MATLKKPTEEMQYILATDVGSTTTKARFFHRKDGEWRFLVAGEAPTTVEAPYEDVTMGVQNAVREVEELTGHKILSQDGSGIVVPYDGKMGVDLYCTTSSAGGGLQMMVAGLIKSMTAMSANRAALPQPQTRHDPSGWGDRWRGLLPRHGDSGTHQGLRA
jgi:hypothetical protein